MCVCDPNNAAPLCDDCLHDFDALFVQTPPPQASIDFTAVLSYFDEQLHRSLGVPQRLLSPDERF